MMDNNTCRIVGTIRKTSGAPAANETIHIVQDNIRRAWDGAALPVVQHVTADGNGVVDFDLIPGHYRLVWQDGTAQAQHRLYVPDAPLVYLQDAARGRESPWEPAFLFGGGRAGFWAPPDNSLFYQDAAGTTPVTTFDQPVGKIVRGAGTVDLVQSVSASRPTMARWPRGGRRSLLVNSDVEDQINNGIMIDDTPIVIDGSIIPMREFSVDTPDPSLLTNPSKWWPNAVGVDATLSVYVNTKGNRYIYFSSNSAGSQSNVGVKGRYDTTDGSVYIKFSGNTQAFGVKVLHEYLDIYRVVINIRPMAAHPTGKRFGVFCTDELTNLSSNTYLSTFTVKPVTGFSVGGWQAEDLGDVALNPDPTPYQKVTTENDVTEEGVPSLWHLSNPGGKSMKASAVMPAGEYGYAWIDPYGNPTFTTLMSDGINPVTALGDTERYGPPVIRQGDFTPEEKDLMAGYWEQIYGTPA